MKKALILVVLCLIGALTATAFRPDTDPNDVLQKITAMRAAKFKEAQDAGKTADFTAIQNEAVEIARTAVKGVDPNMVDAKLGYAWAQLFQMAGQTKDACDAASKYVGTNPGTQEKYRAQMLMIQCCNTLGEGHMVGMLVGEIQPPDPMSSAIFLQSTARMYAATIQKTEGLDAALKAIDTAEAKVDYDKLLQSYKDQEAQRVVDEAKRIKDRDDKIAAGDKTLKPIKALAPQDPVLRVEAIRAAIGEAKANLFGDAGKREEAIKAIDAALGKIRPESTAARSLKASKVRMTLISSMAPPITAEKSIGEYKGLAALKGKVVIVDFFAHWCGPCIASFPDMEQMYADLHDKGLEVVGFTTYYGYYKGEGMPERNMARDVEFGHLGDFLKEYKIPWTVVVGERSNFDAYGITGIPTAAVIGRDGLVHELHVGYSKESFAAFRKEIEKLIAGG